MGGKLAFVFSGLGPGRAAMARGLLDGDTPFRAELERGDAVVRRLAGWSPIARLSAGEPLDDCNYNYAATVCVEVALAAWWRAEGVTPDAVVGISGGEVAAACAAGALDLADALLVAVETGARVQRYGGAWRMLATSLDAGALAARIANSGALAVVCAELDPAFTVAAGAPAELERLRVVLADDGCDARHLPLTWAAHARHLDPIADDLERALSSLQPRAGGVAMVSTVSGDFIDGRSLDARHFRRQVLTPVLFAGAAARLIDNGFDAFVEIGPAPTVERSLERLLGAAGRRALVTPSLAPPQAELVTLRRSLDRIAGWRRQAA